MKYIAALLVILLITKDASHLGDRYIMRGIGQGLWLFVGFFWIMSNIERIHWRSYTLFSAYFLVLFISATLSSFRIEALIQVASLLSVFIFSIAIVESNQFKSINNAIMSSVFWSYLIVCTVSLVLIKVAPDIAYQVGNIAGGTRFAGLFNRPGMLGVASGILLGIALFGKFDRNPPMKIIRIIAVVIALACLFLAGARTFWVAGFVALALTVARKYRFNIAIFVVAGVVIISTILFIYASDFNITRSSKEAGLRTESVSNLTGRTEIWEETFTALKRKPLFGFGFGMTGNALMRLGSKGDYFRNNNYKFKISPTLHNGYIQAIADSGYIGGSLYTMLIIITLITFFRKSVIEKYGLEFYLVTFLAVGNITESIIFKASTLQSMLFWYLIIVGFRTKFVKNITFDK